jgi:hypothetical protein
MAMTEQEWLACADPEEMLMAVGDKASDRKLRLLAVACCRSMWKFLTDERSRRAVDLTEQFSDGNVSVKDMERARRAAYSAAQQEQTDSFLAAISVWNAARPAIRNGLRLITNNVGAGRYSDFFREILGDPFRPVSVHPSWLTTTVVALAQSIYDDRAFDRLPILADALEDAGCDNADILNHCRQPGVHVRGCWVVDLVLEKE